MSQRKKHDAFCYGLISFLGLSLILLYDTYTRKLAELVLSSNRDQITAHVKNQHTNLAARIPNIVHKVWVLRDPNDFRLDFKQFVSFYSAHLYFHPDTIYIHTDSSPEIFESAKVSGDFWTQRTLGIPNVLPNYIVTPNSTTRGIKIQAMEHASDFLRMDALNEFGGIYLDSDAVPLRDIEDLRHSGFANVVGVATAIRSEHAGKINNGVIMSEPGSILMDAYIRCAHEVFDGSWSTASVLLLTDLAKRLVAVPYEVMVLAPNAFAPTSWEFEDQEKLFLPHNQTTAPTTLLADGGRVEEPENSDRAIGWLKALEKKHREDWELDFSSTYVLHAFDDGTDDIEGWDHEVNLEYVLARQSNYARAVYPAVQHAIKAGFIPL